MKKKILKKKERKIKRNPTKEKVDGEHQII